MQIHRDIENLPKFKRPVITVGSFDGVHRGHRVLFDRVMKVAREVDGESVIVTFYPHPRQIIYPRDNSFHILTTLEEKIELIKKTGVDHLIIVPFSIEFSHITAIEYITNFLVARFAPHTIVVGYDHHFGRNRGGGVRLLMDFGRRYNYHVEEVQAEELENITISSTKVRNALDEANIELANEYLSYNYLLHGRVVHGLKIGSQIGFPTANLELENKLKLLPPIGIYAVNVHYDGKRYGGMLYIGTKSTVVDGEELAVEVNIFEFNQSLYGEEIMIEFISYIRGDEKFDSIDSLRDQLQKDKQNTVMVLNAKS